MKILQYLLIISALASLLVAGPNLASVPPYAFAANSDDDADDGNNKFAVDYKNRINDKNTIDITTASSLSPGTLGSNVNQGQQGPVAATAGQTERQGQQGPAAGPPARSLDVIERNSDRASVSPGQHSTMTANCDPGETATGGGYQIQPNGHPTRVYQNNASLSNTGWEIRVFNPGPGVSVFNAYAECASLSPSKPTTTTPPPVTPKPLSFNDPVHLDNSSGDQTDPHIASSGSNVYAVWTNEVNGQSGILFARSTDGGATFSTPVPLSDSFSFLPDVAVDKNNNNNVYVVWTHVTTESEIVLVKSTDGGVTFGPPVVLNPGDFSNGRTPVIAVAGELVYAAWMDFTTSTSLIESEIFFAVSSDGGASFESPINISNTTGTLSKNPSIAAFGNDVYVTWSDCTALGAVNCKIWYTKSSNVGLDFTSPVALTAPESSLSDIKAFENNVYLVYGQAYPVNGVTVRDVFLIKSTDGGQSFGGPVNLSTSLPNSVSQNPNIDVDINNVAITWEDRSPSSTSPHWEVFFVGSTDAGNTFSDPISLSSSLGNRDATFNDIAISGSDVYSVWTTFEDGTSNIYFAKGNLGSP